MEHPIPYVYQQGCPRDEGQDCQRGWREYRQAAMDGHIPLHVHAHTACRGQQARVCKLVHHLRHCRLQKPYIINSKGAKTRHPNL